MRVLTITNLYPNPYQPTRATFNRQQLRALHQQHPVRVISPIAWTEELPARLRQGRQIPSTRTTHLDTLSIAHPRYLFTPKILRSRYGNFYRRSIRRAFEEALDEFHPDIVFAPWAYPDGWAAVKLAHAHDLPCVIKVHGCDVLAGGEGLHRYPGRYQPTIDALRQADAVIAVSHHLADACINLGVQRNRLRVVYDGVDDALFHPGTQLDARRAIGHETTDPIILFIGQLVPVKGIETLIDASAHLLAQAQPFHALIIGSGPLHAELQERINRLNLQPCVHLLGPKPHSELPNYFRAATTFVLPSHSEGLPCVLLEAAACGTPFVASRVGGIPEIAHLVESRLVPPGNAAQLAGAIGEIIAHRAAQPAAAQAPIRTHATAAAEIADLFHALLAGTNPKEPSDDPARRRTRIFSN